MEAGDYKSRDKAELLAHRKILRPRVRRLCLELMKCLCLIMLISLTGCARFVFPSPAQIKAFAGDTNSWDISIKTVYGNADIKKNVQPGSSIPMTLQVRQIQ